MIVKFIDSQCYHITVEGVWQILYDFDDCVNFRPIQEERALIIRSDEDPTIRIICTKAKVDMKKIKGGLTVI